MGEVHTGHPTWEIPFIQILHPRIRNLVSVDYLVFIFSIHMYICIYKHMCIYQDLCPTKINAKYIHIIQSPFRRDYSNNWNTERQPYPALLT